MPKMNGLGVRLYTHGYDLSGDANALSDLRTSAELLDVTALEHAATARLEGREDGHVSVNAWFEPSVLTPTADNLGQHQAWTVAGKLPTTDRCVLIPVGTSGAPAVGDPAAMLVAKQSNYNVQRQPGSAIAATADFDCNDFGLAWGKMLTAGKVTHAAAAQGTSIDGAASSAAGAQAMVHVFSVATGTVVPVIQDSADDTTFAAITGLTFAGVATAGAPTAERLATASDATIRRYVRLATTGTFTNAVLAAAVKRN